MCVATSVTRAFQLCCDLCSTWRIAYVATHRRELTKLHLQLCRASSLSDEQRLAHWLASLGADKACLRECRRAAAISPGDFEHRVDMEGMTNRASRPTALPVVVEDKIAVYVLAMADCGHVLKSKQLQLHARGVVATLKLDVGTWCAGKRWLQAFLRRHPEICRCTRPKTTRTRLATATGLNVDKWNSVTGVMLKQYDAKHMFIVDDTDCIVEYGKAEGRRGAHLGACPASRSELTRSIYDFVPHCQRRCSAARARRTCTSNRKTTLDTLL